jgi:hypothetical protein
MLGKGWVDRDPPVVKLKVLSARRKGGAAAPSPEEGSPGRKTVAREVAYLRERAPRMDY